MSKSELNFTRRDALKLGMYAGAAGIAAGYSSTLLAADSLPLITKPIPSTGEKLPAIGVGTNSFTEANIPTLQAMLQHMHDAGGMVIDTAASYGESEATIGKLLDNLKLRDKFFISTKFMSADTARDKIGGEQSFERSLERLKTDHLDLLMVHSLNGMDELMPKLQEWKKAGKIRYLGMTTSNVAQHPQMVEYMKKYPVDFVQVNYSIESREAESTVLTTALDRKVAVMINVPFGGRGGRTLLAADGRALPPWAADINCSSWSQFLLKFVISHPAVTVAIPGSTKVEHMESNQAAARGVLPDAVMRKRMQEYWDAKA